MPLTWGGKEQKNVLWKVPVPGQRDKARQDQNQSSPIVVRGRVFVTASYWPMGTDPKGYPEHHVVCYQASDGKQVWDVTIKPGPWLLSDLRGGYTAPTPACDGERVYVLFGSSVLAALELDGKLVWRKEIKPFNFDVCIGASPVLHGDSVLVMCDLVSNNSRLLAFERKTGALKWQQARPKLGFGHSTPVVARIGARTQLLVAGSNALQGLDPDSGKVLWWCAARGDTVSPVLGGGVVYIDSGRGDGPGVAVDPTGEGDVTKSHLKWQVKSVPEGFSSPVVAGDAIYRLTNPGVLRSWKLATGEERFAERLQGVNAAVSPIATADGRVYVVSAGRVTCSRQARSRKSSAAAISTTAATPHRPWPAASCSSRAGNSSTVSAPRNERTHSGLHPYSIVALPGARFSPLRVRQRSLSAFLPPIP